MIRYPFDQAWIEEEIKKIDKKWLEKAAKRTKTFIRQGFYEEKSSIWSDVKPVFMAIQHNKCIFCERQFEGIEYGKIEHDLEHFRPKNAVDAWPVARSRLQYPFATGEKFDAGYYWLAYDLQNYAASCKVCNSTFKSAFFPISGQRANVPQGEHDVSSPSALKSEQALLCYPLGEMDDDPEDLITFSATTAVPVHATGFKNERARVIIDFFGLNEREHLHIERARMIALFGSAFKNQDDGTPSEVDLKYIEKASAKDLPHSACLQAFVRLWTSDVPLARQIFAQCRELALGRDRS